MKIIFSALAMVLGFASAPTFAQTTSSSGADATAGATAAAMLQGGSSYSGSVGAANCAWAVNVGPIGTSQMTDICKRDIASNYWAKRGRMDIADEIMAQSPITQAAMKAMAARAAKKTSVTASTKSASSIDLKAVVRAMNAAERSAYETCTVMQVGGVRFKKTGC